MLKTKEELTGYANIGQDESGQVIANCLLCDTNGVSVATHAEECPKRLAKGEMCYYTDDQNNWRTGKVERVPNKEYAYLKDQFSKETVHKHIDNIDIMSDNQKKFIRDALEQGLEIDYNYSGRGMFGRRCPCVKVDSPDSFNCSADTYYDQLGLGYVIYARN